MPTLLEDVDLLLTSAPSDTRAVYDRIADQYEEFRTLWVRLAGNAVECSMLEELQGFLYPVSMYST